MEKRDDALRVNYELKGELLHALFRLKNIRFRRVGGRRRGLGGGFGPAGFGRGEECGAGFGLNMTEFAFLKRLLLREEHGESGGAWLTDMREYLCVSKAAVSQTISSLEGNGLLTREADPENRRTIIVKATEGGRELVSRMERQFDDHLNRVIERAGERDTREIIRLIYRFADIVEELMEETKENVEIAEAGVVEKRV